MLEQTYSNVLAGIQYWYQKTSQSQNLTIIIHTDQKSGLAILQIPYEYAQLIVNQQGMKIYQSTKQELLNKQQKDSAVTNNITHSKYFLTW